MGWFNRKKPKEKEIDLKVELLKYSELIKPYIDVPLLFGRFPVVFLSPTIKDGKVHHRYKTNECLTGHCKLLSVPHFIWKFGQSGEWNEAKYNFLRLQDTIKKFKAEGYEV